MRFDNAKPDVPRGGRHDQSELKAAFAAASGLSLRSAQNHARRNSDEWQAFLRDRGQGGAALADPRASQGAALTADGFPPANVVDMLPPEDEADELAGRDWPSVAHEMEERHLRLWRQNILKAERAATPDLELMFSRAAKEALEAYHKARKARVQADLDARRLVPAADFDRFIQFVSRLAQVVTGLDLELASQANPEQPEVAALACRRWLETRWNPALAEVIDAAA